MDEMAYKLMMQSGVMLAQQGANHAVSMDRNLTQGLGVIHNSLIQSQGAVSDDGQLIASLQTASRAPVQGSNDLAK